MDLKGTVSLITGGGTGLGKAIGLIIARQGGDVAVNYSRSQAEAEETVAELRALGIRAEAVRGDVANADDAARIVEDTVERLGRLDVLVNNAGTTVFVPFQDLDGISEADWDRVMAVNVKGPFMVSRAAARHMRERGGRILNVVSIGGIQPFSSSLVYSCSKAAEIMLTKGLAVALAPTVLVNGIAPGLLMTRWTAGHPQENIDRFMRSALLKRVPTVEDTAQMGVDLIRNDSMTGQVVNVDAGTIVNV